MSKVNRYPPAPEYIRFMCPGCGEQHSVVEGRWTFNGNVEKPTLNPSVLVRSGHYADGNTKECWCNYNERYPDKPPAPFKCYRCHSFVRDGMIQFLGDCTHSLAGQSVPLPEWPQDMDE